jgi:hypothetical protein
MPGFEQAAAFVADEWGMVQQRERLAIEIKRIARDYDIQHLDTDHAAGRRGP